MNNLFKSQYLKLTTTALILLFSRQSMADPNGDVQEAALSANYNGVVAAVQAGATSAGTSMAVIKAVQSGNTNCDSSLPYCNRSNMSSGCCTSSLNNSTLAPNVLKIINYLKSLTGNQAVDLTTVDAAGYTAYDYATNTNLVVWYCPAPNVPGTFGFPAYYLTSAPCNNYCGCSCPTIQQQCPAMYSQIESIIQAVTLTPTQQAVVDAKKGLCPANAKNSDACPLPCTANNNCCANNTTCSDNSTTGVCNNGHCISCSGGSNLTNNNGQFSCECPTNATLVNQACQCNGGSNLVNNNGVYSCECPGATAFNNGLCQCPINQFLINNAPSGTCGCFPNSTLVNGTCQCNPGTYFVNYSLGCLSPQSSCEDDGAC